MRRLMYSVLFALLCLSTIVLSQPALAAPREMNELSILTAHSSFQMGGTYMSSRYNIAGVELYSYPARRIFPTPTPHPHKTKVASADTFFYDSSSSDNKTGAE